MKVSHPLNPSALIQVKKLALRFSKEIEKQTGHRIRGAALYNAFAKVAGYESFAQAKSLTGRCNDSFDYHMFVIDAVRMIRKYLPVTIDGPVIELALEEAKDAGRIGFAINTSKSPLEWQEKFTNYPFVKSLFQSSILNDRVHFPTEYSFTSQGTHYSVLLDDIKDESIKIDLDYSQWKDESDPMNEEPDWIEFFDNIVGVMDSGHSMQIKVVKTQNEQIFTLVGKRGSKFLWKPMYTIEELKEVFSDKFEDKPVSNSDGKKPILIWDEAHLILDSDNGFKDSITRTQSMQSYKMEKPKLSIDIEDAPSDVKLKLLDSEAFIVVQGLADRNDVDFFLNQGLLNSTEFKNNWSIRASFDSYGAKDVPIDIAVKWYQLKSWLLNFYSTERIVLSERITDANWDKLHVQYAPDVTIETLKDGLSTHFDEELFELLLSYQ